MNLLWTYGFCTLYFEETPDDGPTTRPWRQFPGFTGRRLAPVRRVQNVLQETGEHECEDAPVKRHRESPRRLPMPEALECWNVHNLVAQC